MRVEPSILAARATRGTAGRLREALVALAGGLATIVNHSEKSWASITFAGTRHRLELAFAGDAPIAAGELFIAFLPEHEFALPGQLVADAAITAVDHTLMPEPRLRVRVELLLLDES
ncbi:MAG: hypothetical protein ABIP41_03885 [Croceibacterium sp.]